MKEITKERIDKIKSYISDLTPVQFDTVENIIIQFREPIEINVYNNCFFTKSIAETFGDYLKIHHCISDSPFEKDKFEYTMEQSFLQNGIYSKCASKGNPGEDIAIGKERFSLKTQADKKIKKDEIHVSKYMELGKGKWEVEEDLYGLRDRFIEHLTHYERILTLRCLSRGPKWHYELVEIPKNLLLLSKNGYFKIEMRHASKQTPKPGYCYVYENDKNNNLLYQLYFDGGTERKLQIRKLKKSLCIVLAEWSFTINNKQS